MTLRGEAAAFVPGVTPEEVFDFVLDPAVLDDFLGPVAQMTAGLGVDDDPSSDNGRTCTDRPPAHRDSRLAFW